MVTTGTGTGAHVHVHEKTTQSAIIMDHSCTKLAESKAAEVSLVVFESCVSTQEEIVS